MNPRRVILIVLVLAIVYGVVKFAIDTVQTRSQLALVASKEVAKQEEGVKSLMQRGVLFDALQSGANKETRLAAIETLTRLAEGGKNPEAFEQLLQMLKDPDTESVETKTHPVRDAAKAAVARVGINYQEALFKAAKNPDGNIRDQSRAALKDIGRPLKEEMAKRLDDGDLRPALGDMLSSIGPETVPLIAPYLKSPLLKADDAGYKTQLIEILGKFTVAEAAEPILPFINDPNPNVRRSAVTALANIAHPVGAPVLIAALSDPSADASARAAAAGALGAIATPEANAAMQKAVTDYDVVVATAATAGLRRAGDKAATNIAALLAHPEPAVRQRAAEAAGGLRSVALAVRATADTDAGVRAAAIESLGDILTKANTIRQNMAILARNNDPAQSDEKTSNAVSSMEQALQALQAQNALSELNQPYAPSGAKANVVALLNQKANAETDEARRKPFTDLVTTLNTPVAQTPLADATSPAALAPLLKALNDSDGRVAQSAVTALGRLGEPAVGSLVALLGSPNETVAYYSSQALTAIGEPAVEALLPLARPGNPAARWAAITLGEIGDARAADTLQALTQSPDPDTAYVAGTALAKIRA